MGVLQRLWRWATRVKPINRRRIVDGAHFLRYHLSPKKWPLHLVLHHLLRADWADDPHDHPAWFISLVLRGGYLEQVYDIKTRTAKLHRRSWLSLQFRPASFTHLITEVEPNTWTLVLWGPNRRQWGFWAGKEHTNFVPEKEYLGFD